VATERGGEGMLTSVRHNESEWNRMRLARLEEKLGAESSSRRTGHSAGGGSSKRQAVTLDGLGRDRGEARSAWCLPLSRRQLGRE